MSDTDTPIERIPDRHAPADESGELVVGSSSDGPTRHNERPGGLLSKVASHLVMYHDPRSIHAEQYRACRTNLTALNRNGGPWSVVLTSSRKGEGKSVTAANLAACMSELPGAKVCLVDADFRAPTQATVFGVDNEPGVADALNGTAPLKRIIHRTVLPNLDLIGSGAHVRSPAELMGSERFSELINELKRRYTWILIDTPPVNPYTDACVLTTRCNGALLVVRMEETTRDLVKLSLDNLKRAGGRVLGTFLTGVSGDRDDSERYGYYRYDASDKNVAKEEVARDKARHKAQRKLKAQEKAYLKLQKKKEKAERQDEEPQV